VAENTYAISEVVGSSKIGVDDAIRGAVTKAATTLHNLDWFEVTQIRGHIEGGEIGHVQVTVKLGFKLDEAD
jgi:flavin-binding protein dodecin